MSNDKTSNINPNNNGDDALKRLYHRASIEEPSTELDREILSLAAQNVKLSPPIKQRTHHWYVPFSVAATIVLCSSLIITMNTHDPVTSTTKQELQRIVPPLASSPPLPSIDSIELEDEESIQPTESAMLALPRKESTQSRKSEMLPSTTLPLRESTLSIDNAEEKIENFKIEALSNGIASSDKHRAKKDLTIFQKKQSSSSHMECNSINQDECLNSPDCTLELTSPENEYLCRDNKNYCEDSFIQQTADKANCLTKKGCQFSPKHCLCPDAEDCNCNIIKPATCQLTKP